MLSFNESLCIDSEIIQGSEKVSAAPKFVPQATVDLGLWIQTSETGFRAGTFSHFNKTCKALAMRQARSGDRWGLCAVTVIIIGAGISCTFSPFFFLIFLTSLCP